MSCKKCEENHPAVDCAECGGSGKVSEECRCEGECHDEGQHERECPECGGHGHKH